MIINLNNNIVVKLKLYLIIPTDLLLFIPMRNK